MRLEKAPENATHRVMGQIGLTHPGHIHPRHNRPKVTKRAIREYDALVDDRGLRAEIAAAQSRPGKLSKVGLGWLFAAMFAPAATECAP